VLGALAATEAIKLVLDWEPWSGDY